jgi:hypothetical protein
LQSWAKATWPEVHTNPATWTPADVSPGIYWRVVRIAPVQITAAVSWMEAQLMGHVLAPSAAARLTWGRKGTERLAAQRRLKMSDGSPLELLRVAADSEADLMRRGQIQLTARYGVLQPIAPSEVLERAVLGGAITGEVI